MTTANMPSGEMVTTWTIVRPGVWRDGTTTSKSAATEFMAKRLDRAGAEDSAQRMRTRRKRSR